MTTYCAPGYCQELGRKCVDARAEIERLRAENTDLKMWGTGRHALRHSMEAEIELLKAALRAVMPIAEAFKGRTDMEPQLQIGRDALEGKP